MLPHSAVLTTPGETMLTRMGASSTASARVSPSIAEQMLDATAQPACGRRPATPELNTIEPPLRILPLPYLAAQNAPQYRVEKSRRAAARGVAPKLRSCGFSPAVKTK